MNSTTWRLPGYVIGPRLGSGGSGEVWSARVAATGEAVALKRIALSGSDSLRAARTEAALLIALDHPHLVRLHGLIPTSDATVLVLDLADGGSLADLFARRGKLAVGEVVTALAPIGAALAYAHRRGVIHGDIAPGNILFTSIGAPMLADLGVGRIVGDAVAARCTPDYADPAVARGCAPGPSSDVFMLGAVALRALTGSPVWPGATPAEILANAAAGDLADVPERLATLPPSVAAVLAQALVGEPQLRCTAAEFALDLRHSAEPMPVELHAGRNVAGTPGVAGLVGTPGALGVVGTPDAAGRVADHVVASRVAAGSRPPGAHRAVTRGRRKGKAAAERGRPAFARPGPAPATPGREGALTHRVKAPPRPTLPPPPGRLRVLLDQLAPTGRLLRIGIAALFIPGVALAVALLWSSSRSPADAAHQPAATARSPNSSSVPAAAPPAVSRPPPGTVLAPAEALRRLDDLRVQAFARRDVDLLAQVYVRGPLLEEDTALLERIVPVGCGLVGARTEFRNVEVTSTTVRGVTIRATAQLAPSTLTCGEAVSGRASGAGPTELRIELRQQNGQFRIAGQLAS